MFHRPSPSPNQLPCPMAISFSIAENDSVRLLDKICTQLDYSSLRESYRRQIGYRLPPAILFVRSFFIPTFLSPPITEVKKLYMSSTDWHEEPFQAFQLRENQNPCPNSQTLRVKYTRVRTSARGYGAKSIAHEAENCAACSLKSQCTRSKEKQTLQLSPTFLKQRAASRQNITIEQGYQLSTNPSIQTEGAFGIIKQDYR